MKTVVYDTCRGFEGNLIPLFDGPAENREVAEEVGAVWVRRFPTDIVMVVEEQ